MRHSCLLLGVSALAFCAETVTTPINNDQVRVLQVLQQPHEKTKLHEHKVNRVMIYLNDGSQDIISQDGKKTVLKFHSGEAKWSAAGGLHTSELTSNEPIRIVEIEVKKPGDPGKTALQPKHPLNVGKKIYKLEFENPQVRVFREILAPHQTAPMHDHTINRVVVCVTDGNLKVESNGHSETKALKPGDVVWGGSTVHAEQNLGDKPVQLLVVELKN